MRDQPIWDVVVEAEPDLFVHLGDAIYPDITDDETALIDPWPNPESVARIAAAYAKLAARPEFIRLRESVPVMAVWDDHDFGINDGDREFALKEESQQLFLDFFGEPADSRRRSTPGIYESRIFGPEGRRVQVILLDVRYFRSPPTPDTRSDEEKRALNIAGRYVASVDPDATVLGDDTVGVAGGAAKAPCGCTSCRLRIPGRAHGTGKRRLGELPARTPAPVRPHRRDRCQRRDLPQWGRSLRGDLRVRRGALSDAGLHLQPAGGAQRGQRAPSQLPTASRILTPRRTLAWSSSNGAPSRRPLSCSGS